MLKDITDLRFIPEYLTLIKDNPIDSIILLPFNVTLLLVILGILASIHKFFIKHMLRLHVYHYAKSRKLYQWDGMYVKFLNEFTSRFYNKPIPSEWLCGFSSYLILKFTPYTIKHEFLGIVSHRVDYQRIPKYHPFHILIKITDNRYLNLAILLSPLLLIFEDCVFNDFQIRYLSYYMLFYTPILLLWRIGRYIHSLETAIIETLYEIYYIEPEKSGVYAAAPFIQNIINMYLQNNLTTSPGAAVELTYDLGSFFRTYKGLWFELEDEKHKIYVNGTGYRIILDTNCIPNRAYLLKEDEDGLEYLDDEMYILLIKDKKE